MMEVIPSDQFEIWVTDKVRIQMTVFIITDKFQKSWLMSSSSEMSKSMRRTKQWQSMRVFEKLDWQSQTMFSQGSVVDIHCHLEEEVL